MKPAGSILNLLKRQNLTSIENIIHSVVFRSLAICEAAEPSALKGRADCDPGMFLNPHQGSYKGSPTLTALNTKYMKYVLICSAGTFWPTVDPSFFVLTSSSWVGEDYKLSVVPVTSKVPGFSQV